MACGVCGVVGGAGSRIVGGGGVVVVSREHERRDLERGLLLRVVQHEPGARGAVEADGVVVHHDREGAVHRDVRVRQTTELLRVVVACAQSSHTRLEICILRLRRGYVSMYLRRARALVARDHERAAVGEGHEATPGVSRRKKGDDSVYISAALSCSNKHAPTRLRVARTLLQREKERRAPLQESERERERVREIPDSFRNVGAAGAQRAKRADGQQKGGAAGPFF